MSYMWRQQNDISFDTDPQSTREKLVEKEITEAMDYRLENMSLKKGKRFRSAFTTEQVNYLENEFRKFPYIGNVQRKEVANLLNIPERAIKIWFQNRRMKEKKDAVSNKDPEYDDRNNYKNVELTNDQLLNMRSFPSVNEQSSNTLSIITEYEDTPNKKNDIDTNITCEVQEIPGPPKITFYKELPQSQEQVPHTHLDYRSSPPVILNNTIPPASTYRSSAEFSIDLCKKYKNVFVNNTEQLKRSKSENAIAQPLEPMKQEATKNEFKYTPERVPQDLSYNKSNYQTQSESSPKNASPNNRGFPPVYVANYAQPYVPAGNMVWKPVNVMPVMSTGASGVTISSNLAASLPVTQNQNAPKKPCTCDCHDTPGTADLAENNQNAQYIITALPVQNYPKF